MEKCEQKQAHWVMGISTGRIECVWSFWPTILVLVCLLAISGTLGCFVGIKIQQARVDAIKVEATYVVQLHVSILDMLNELAFLSQGPENATIERRTRVLREKRSLLGRLFMQALKVERYNPELAQQTRELILQYSEKL